MSIIKFFNKVFSKPENNTYDFLNRTAYRNIPDPLLKPTIIVLIIFLVFIVALFFLTAINIIETFPSWSFGLSLLLILMIYYPRKCTSCAEYMTEVFIDISNSTDRSTFYCCDNCRVKTKTKVSDGNIVT